MVKDEMNLPKTIILHCADTQDYNPGHSKFDSIGVKQIDRWHRERGFDCCGYHDVIRQSGVIERGRELHVQGAHTLGKNQNSIGICLIGRRNFIIEQVQSLTHLYRKYKNEYQIEASDWYAHYEFDNGKTCPNIPINLLRYFLARAV